VADRSGGPSVRAVVIMGIVAFVLLAAAFPGATIYQLNDDGIRPVPWRELELVDHWRRYLADPTSYLRYALADED